MSELSDDAGIGDGSSAADRAMPAPTYEEYLARHEEHLAYVRLSSIEAGRRKAGVAGAAMAGAMLVVSEIYEGPPKDDAPVTVEASSDPHDIDRDGIDLAVGDVEVTAPPLPSLDVLASRADQRGRPQV